MNLLGKLTAVLLLTLVSGMAPAKITGSLLMASLAEPRDVGGLTGFDLIIRTGTLGAPPGITSPLWSGGITIAFDPNVLSFHSFEFAFTGPNTSSYLPMLNSGCATVALTACYSGIQFKPGDPPSPYDTEVIGGLRLGTFLFNYLGGESLLELGEDPGAPFKFYLNSSERTYEETQFSNASIVPLPLAAWLMLSGLTVLGAFGFRKSR